MRRAARLGVPLLALAAVLAHAQVGGEPGGRRAARPAAPDWEFAATGYWNAPRAGDAYASGIFAAERGPLHLEARANYEAVHAQSAFVGWTFAAGDAIKVEATPIVGVVTGALRGTIAGLEASIAAGRFDYYIEAEHVRDRQGKDGDYTYAWSEAGFRPVEWLRVGLVTQRTRAYGGERDLQRGGFAQVSQGTLTFSAYWFNPGSQEQVVIVSVGASF